MSEWRVEHELKVKIKEENQPLDMPKPAESESVKKVPDTIIPEKTTPTAPSATPNVHDSKNLKNPAPPEEKKS